ncbi:MAG: IS110 family transposase [Fibrobacterales bacterium]
MRYYKNKHKYYCGIDLHTKTMYVVIVDSQGLPVFEQNMNSTPQDLFAAIQPYREDIVVGVECIFSWYWMADWCHENEVDFILGHALYMKMIHGSKVKNDKIDAQKIAQMIFAGLFPLAYSYPDKELRAIRDLLRRRMKLMHDRAELMTHIKILGHQINNSFGSLRLNYKYNRKDLEKAFENSSYRLNCEADLQLIDDYDRIIGRIEAKVKEEVTHRLPKELNIVQSIPGVGKIIGLALVLEIGDIKRFDTVQQFASYCRLVRCKHESAGKSNGHGPKKIGNPYLKWAFSEATCLLMKSSDQAKKHVKRLERKHGKGKAMSLLAHRIGRSVFTILKNEKVFDIDKCFGK